MKKLNWYTLVPITLLFIIVCFYILTSSSLVRFWADDFCSSVLLRNNGFIKAQVAWWNGWTGRYSYIAFLDLFESLGLFGAKILPLILFSLLLLSSVIFLSIPISILFVTILMVNSPNIIQSFYWMTGSLNYFAPFLFLNLFVSLLFFKYKKSFPIIGFILLFIATGFSEAFGVANILFLVYLLLIVNEKDKRTILIYGLISSFVSLGIMYLSPGNAVRSSLVSHPSSISNLVSDTLRYSKWYLIHLFYIKSFLLSVVVIFTGVSVFYDSKNKFFLNPNRVMAATLFFIIGVTIAVVGLTYQAMNWEPPERVMSIVNNFIIVAISIGSLAFYQLQRRYVPNMIFKVVFVVAVILLTCQLNYDWGKVKQELKNSAESKVYTTVGKLDGLEDNKGWVQSCIIEYYK